MACGGADTLRDVHLSQPGNGLGAVGEHVWWCLPPNQNAHMMTSMVVVGYAHVDFAPTQTFTNLKRVCWDQSLYFMGNARKWVQVTVVPESTYQANGGRLEYVMHDIQNDVAVNGIRLSDETVMFVMGNGSARFMRGQTEPVDPDFAGFSTSNKSTRFTHCIVETATGLVAEFYDRGYTGDACSLGGCDRRTFNHPTLQFPNGPVRVIFQDVTYDSLKDNTAPGDGVAHNTWHWDDIQIS